LHLKTTYIVPLVLSTSGIISNKLHESLKLLNFRPGVCVCVCVCVCMYVYTHSNAESSNTQYMGRVRKFSAGEWIRGVWSVKGKWMMMMMMIKLMSSIGVYERVGWTARLSIKKPAQEHKTRKQWTYYNETKTEYEINKRNIVTLKKDGINEVQEYE